MTTTNLTSDEREERLKQVRLRHCPTTHCECPTPKWQMREDIDFLLSLLDSQAVDNHDSCSHWREGDSDNCVWCGDDLGPTDEADVAGEIPDAATRMRDKCVEKVREWLGKADFDYGPLVREIQSLTLDNP